MAWSRYREFLLFAVVVVLIPGPDFAVVTKTTLVGGRARGRWTSVGICTSNLLQGSTAAAGLSAVVVKVQPLFDALRWAGVCYLLYLGAQSLRSALGRAGPPAGTRPDHGGRAARGGWRQGFVSNVTNPKVLVFYLAVLPQFLRPGTGVGWLLALAWSHAALSLAYLFGVTTALDQMRRALARRRVRRAMDAVTGTALVGFGVRLATEHV